MLPTPKRDDAKYEVKVLYSCMIVQNDDTKLHSVLNNHLCKIHWLSELAFPFRAIVGNPQHEIDHDS